MVKMQPYHQQRRQVAPGDTSPTPKAHAVPGEGLPLKIKQSTVHANESKTPYRSLVPSSSNVSQGNIAPLYSNATSHSEATTRALNTRKARASPSVTRFRIRQARNITSNHTKRAPAVRFSTDSTVKSELEPPSVNIIEEKSLAQTTKLGGHSFPLKMVQTFHKTDPRLEDNRRK